MDKFSPKIWKIKIFSAAAQDGDFSNGQISTNSGNPGSNSGLNSVNSSKASGSSAKSNFVPPANDNSGKEILSGEINNKIFRVNETADGKLSSSISFSSGTDLNTANLDLNQVAQIVNLAGGQTATTGIANQKVSFSQAFSQVSPEQGLNANIAKIHIINLIFNSVPPEELNEAGRQKDIVGLSPEEKKLRANYLQVAKTFLRKIGETFKGKVYNRETLENAAREYFGLLPGVPLPPFLLDLLEEKFKISGFSGRTAFPQTSPDLPFAKKKSEVETAQSFAKKVAETAGSSAAVIGAMNRAIQQNDGEIKSTTRSFGKRLNSKTDFTQSVEDQQKLEQESQKKPETKNPDEIISFSKEEKKLDFLAQQIPDFARDVTGEENQSPVRKVDEVITTSKEGDILPPAGSINPTQKQRAEKTDFTQDLSQTETPSGQVASTTKEIRDLQAVAEIEESNLVETYEKEVEKTDNALSEERLERLRQNQNRLKEKQQPTEIAKKEPPKSTSKEDLSTDLNEKDKEQNTTGLEQIAVEQNQILIATKRASDKTLPPLGSLSKDLVGGAVRTTQSYNLDQSVKRVNADNADFLDSHAVQDIAENILQETNSDQLPAEDLAVQTFQRIGTTPQNQEVQQLAGILSGKIHHPKLIPSKKTTTNQTFSAQIQNGTAELAEQIIKDNPDSKFTAFDLSNKVFEKIYDKKASENDLQVVADIMGEMKQSNFVNQNLAEAELSEKQEALYQKMKQRMDSAGGLLAEPFVEAKKKYTAWQRGTDEGNRLEFEEREELRNLWKEIQDKKKEAKEGNLTDEELVRYQILGELLDAERQARYNELLKKYVTSGLIFADQTDVNNQRLAHDYKKLQKKLAEFGEEQLTAEELQNLWDYEFMVENDPNFRKLVEKRADEFTDEKLGDQKLNQQEKLTRMGRRFITFKNTDGSEQNVVLPSMQGQTAGKKELSELSEPDLEFLQNKFGKAQLNSRGSKFLSKLPLVGGFFKSPNTDEFYEEEDENGEKKQKYPGGLGPNQRSQTQKTADLKEEDKEKKDEESSEEAEEEKKRRSAILGNRQEMAKQVAKEMAKRAAKKIAMQALKKLGAMALPWIIWGLIIALLFSLIAIISVIIMCVVIPQKLPLLAPLLPKECTALFNSNASGCPSGYVLWTRTANGWQSGQGARLATATESTGGGDGSTDSGVGTSNIYCLAIERSGKYADPYLRAITRAIGSCGIEAPCGGNPYVGWGGGGNGYWGRYQYGLGQRGKANSWDDDRNSTGNQALLAANRLVERSTAGDRQAFRAQDKLFMDVMTAKTFRGDNRNFLQELRSGDGAIRTALNRMCSTWQAMCRSDGKHDKILELFKTALAEEQAGKCGTSASTGSSSSQKQATADSEVIPKFSFNFFGSIKAEAAEITYTINGNDAINGRVTKFDVDSGGIDIQIDPSSGGRKGVPIVSPLKGYVVYVDNVNKPWYNPYRSNLPRLPGSFGKIVGVYYPELDKTVLYSHIDNDLGINPDLVANYNSGKVTEVAPGTLLGYQGRSGSVTGDIIDIRITNKVNNQPYSGQTVKGAFSASSTTIEVDDPGQLGRTPAARAVYQQFIDALSSYYKQNGTKISSKDFSPTTGSAVSPAGFAQDGEDVVETLCCPPGRHPDEATAQLAGSGGTTVIPSTGGGNLPPVGSNAKDGVRPRRYADLTQAHRDFLAKIASTRGYTASSQVATSNLVSVGNGQRMEKSAGNSFNQMKAAAARSGITLTALSGFRSVDDQIGTFFATSGVTNPIPDSKIFNKPGAEQAYLARAELSAPPGFSEHHTGRAIDINSLEKSFANTAGYRWLKANAGKFGFKLSYPEGSTEGAGFEPWHWYYTGGNVSFEDKSNNLRTVAKTKDLTSGDLFKKVIGGIEAEAASSSSKSEQSSSANPGTNQVSVSSPDDCGCVKPGVSTPGIINRVVNNIETPIGDGCIDKVLNAAQNGKIKLWRAQNNVELVDFPVDKAREIIQAGKQAGVPAEVASFVMSIAATESLKDFWKTDNKQGCYGIAQLCSNYVRKDFPTSYQSATRKALGRVPTPQEFMNDPVMQMKAIYELLKEKKAMRAYPNKPWIYGAAARWLGRGCDNLGTCVWDYGEAALRNYNKFTCKTAETAAEKNRFFDTAFNPIGSIPVNAEEGEKQFDYQPIGVDENGQQLLAVTEVTPFTVKAEAAEDIKAARARLAALYEKGYVMQLKPQVRDIDGIRNGQMDENLVRFLLALYDSGITWVSGPWNWGRRYGGHGIRNNVPVYAAMDFWGLGYVKDIGGKNAPIKGYLWDGIMTGHRGTGAVPNINGNTPDPRIFRMVDVESPNAQISSQAMQIFKQTTDLAYSMNAVNTEANNTAQVFANNSFAKKHSTKERPIYDESVAAYHHHHLHLEVWTARTKALNTSNIPSNSNSDSAVNNPCPTATLAGSDNDSTDNANLSGVVGNLNLLAVAKAASGTKKPDGYCYFHVKQYIAKAGFGKIPANGQMYYLQGQDRNTKGRDHRYAKHFAEYMNDTGSDGQKNATRWGLVNLLDKNPNMSPYDAPAGSVVVVSNGSPGTKHEIAGDIAVADGKGAFYNGGLMGYAGEKCWNGPTALCKSNSGLSGGRLLGIYVPIENVK